MTMVFRQIVPLASVIAAAVICVNGREGWGFFLLIAVMTAL